MLDGHYQCEENATAAILSNRGPAQVAEGIEAYQDEFGPIVPEAYKAAQEIRRQAIAYARARGYDEAVCHDQLLRAAATVTASGDFRTGRIKNLEAYLFAVFTQHLRDLFKRDERRHAIERDLEVSAKGADPLRGHGVEEEILLHEVIARIRPGRVAETFDLFLLGHSYAEIARIRDEREDTVRQRIEREIARVATDLRGTVPDATKETDCGTGIRFSPSHLLRKIGGRISAKMDAGRALASQRKRRK